MKFLITAYDYKNALEKRLACREEHILRAKEGLKNGTILNIGALIDEDEKMIGSSCLVKFEDKNALEEWLKDEPYIKNGVWETIKISPIKLLK